MERFLQSKVRPDGICILTFDRPGSAANFFDRETLEQFELEITRLENPASTSRGLVIVSAKPAIFIAGADLRFLASHPSTDDINRFIELGQGLFGRLARLPIPTAAAIHGAALGGGYELCLACDWRVASTAPVTRVGLPETTLGLLPAWGGVTRLPRLIGLEPALDLILSGKPYAAGAALKQGLVDEVVEPEELLEAACGKLAGKRPPRPKPAMEAAEIERVASVRRQTLRGSVTKNQAALKALEVIVSGFSQSEEVSLAGEREAILQLITSESTQNLLRLFFLEERARKKDPTESPPWQARRIAVIGAGTMGSGIAYWASSRGLEVGLVDADPAALDRARDRISKLYESGVKRGVFSKAAAAEHQARIRWDGNLESALAGVDLVIEAVVEKPEIKRKVFQALEPLIPATALLATNTSALSVSELAAATQRPDKVAGLHFFNPVQQMRLVEIVAGAETGAETLRKARRFVQQIGKLPVLVRDSPGFVVNRVLFPYLLEGVRLLEAGGVREEIDGAMVEFGMPMGPLRVLDEVGLDVALDILSTLHLRFGERAQPPESLRQLVSEGRLGRKSGGGLYLPGDDARGRQGDRPADRGTAGFRPSDLRQRMIFMMINEAARCLEEKVAAEAADIDLAMILGAGFPGTRGGPLRYADALGVNRLVAQMSKLAESSQRFAPCDWLRDLAARDGKIYSD